MLKVQLHNGYTLTPFRKVYESKREIAVVFFTLLSAFNKLKLSESDIGLLAHIAVQGGTLSGTCKLRYLEYSGKPLSCVDNTIGRLKRKNLLKKAEQLVIINPVIQVLFTSNKYIFSFKCLLYQKELITEKNQEVTG